MGGGSNNTKKNDKSRSSRSTQRVASKKDLDTFREICQLARIDFERHRETFSTSSLKKSRREKLLDIYADVEHLMHAKRVKEAEKPKNLLRKKCLQYFYGGLEEEGKGGGEEKEKEKEEEENRKETRNETFEEEKKVSMELKRARVKKPSRFDQSEMGALVEAAGGGTTKVAPPPPPALVGVPHGLPSFHMQQQQQQQQQQMMMMMPPYQMQQQQQLFYGQQHLQQQQYQHQAYPIGMSGYQMPPPVLTRQPLGMPPMSVISGQAQYPSPPPPLQQFQEQQPLRFGVPSALESRLTPGDSNRKRDRGGIAMDDDLYSKQNKKKREQRFNNNEHYGEEIERPKSVTRTDSPRGEVTMAELKTGNKRAVGTNQSLTKAYMRLTSDPKASDIRPPAVLKKALALVEEKWKSREWTYDQLKEQLKSIRQDLTVQHAKGPLAVSAYETHARVALEHDDLAEYNQCQTVLKTLHERYINEEKFKDSRGEFAAYRLLYALIADETAKNGRQLFTEMIDLTEENIEHDFVKHALEAIVSVKGSDIVKFFKLRKIAPNYNWNLMQKHANRLRGHALLALCSSHRPTIPVSFFTTTLGFENEEETMEYLKSDEIKAVLIEKKGETPLVDCKNTQTALL